MFAQKDVGRRIPLVRSRHSTSSSQMSLWKTLALVPGLSSGPSPGSVQIASLETDLAIHRELVAQAEANAARARDNLSFAEVMEVELRERIRRAEAAVLLTR